MMRCHLSQWMIAAALSALAGGSAGCLDSPAPFALRVDLAPCVGSTGPSASCGAALRRAVFDGPNACLVLRSATRTQRVVWQWGSADGGRTRAEIEVEVDEPLDAAVFLFAAPVDVAACARLTTDSACADECLARLWDRVDADSNVVDFITAGQCRIEGPVTAAGACGEQAGCGGGVRCADAGTSMDDGIGDAQPPTDAALTVDGADPDEGGEPDDGGDVLRLDMRHRDGAFGVDAGDADPLDSSVDEGLLPDVGCALDDRTCDGVDDDCDGRQDEDAAAAMCWADGVDPQRQSERSVCTAGATRCRAGEWTPCDGIEPVEERCHDGVDQDCDGIVDEACVDGPCIVQSDCPSGPAGAEAICDRTQPGGRCGWITAGHVPPDEEGCRCRACADCVPRLGVVACRAVCSVCAARAAACGGVCGHPADAGPDEPDRCVTRCFADAVCRPGWACEVPLTAYRPSTDDEGEPDGASAVAEGFRLCAPAGE